MQCVLEVRLILQQMRNNIITACVFLYICMTCGSVLECQKDFSVLLLTSIVSCCVAGTLS